MTSKNPFEIRLEVMKMAKEMMDNHYNDSMNAWWTMVNSYADAHNKSVDEMLKQTEGLMKTKPAMYTPSDIMTKAQELYGFVSKKD
jgi:phage-related minor tail protein